MTRPYTLTFRQSKRNGQWRWRIVGGNGELVGHGECHPSKSKARRSVDRMIAAIAGGRLQCK